MTEKEDNHSDPSISWRHLSVEISTQWTFRKSPSKKTILQSISGHFTAGSLNGILGPSGAGKTTLLNVLSGSNLDYSGTFQYFSNTSSSKSPSSSCLPVSYYIRQHVHNCVVLELSVDQLLNYAFCFKNNVTRNGKTAQAHIERTLSDLSLPLDLLHRPLSKCSGGELKRVVVAQELMSLTPPSYIILDEPTTGLDSSSAFEVMSCLKRLTRTTSAAADNDNDKPMKKGMTIIATIHSPNDETLQLFDRLYVIAKGGVPIYEGRPDALRKTLQSVASLSVPSDQPPIEALLKVACSGPSDPKVIQLAKHQIKQSEKAAKTLEQENANLAFQTSERLKGRKRFNLFNFFTHISRQFRITFIAQLPTLLFSPLFLLFFYALICTIFDREMTGPSSCFPALLQNSTAHFNNETAFESTTTTTSATCNSEQRLREETLFKQNAHFISYVVLMVSFIAMLSSTLLYGRALAAFRAEHRNRWYSLGVFTASTWIISFLEITLTTFFVAAFSYLISGQHTIDSDEHFNLTRFQLYLLFVLLIAVYSQSVGHLLGAIFADWPLIAMISCELVAVSASLFNGMYIKLDRMGNQLMVVLEDISALAGLGRGLLYSIYGFERCDFSREYSWVLVEYSVDRARIGEYVWRAVVNVMIFKVMTLAILWWRFSRRPSSKGRKAAVENEVLHFDNTAAVAVEIEELSSEKLSQTVLELKNTEKSIYSLSTTRSSSARSEDELRFMVYTKEKILLAWKNLSLLQSSPSCFSSQKQNAQKPPILNNLDGVIRFNSLTALMGTSGAGKTSLLRVLNGQSKTRLSSATQFHLSSLTSINTCFICQEVSGHLLRGLTAHQMLRYSSMLRNRPTTTGHNNQLLNQPKPQTESYDHDAIASRWLAELGLKDAAQTRVENLSGGEAKRLSVAIELTAEKMPNLLCCDEPTSGCDSNSAETVVRALKRLTEVHPLLTIVTSIHQPSAEVLALYDQLYVLARGGICIYSGKPTAIQASLDAVTSTEIDSEDQQPSSLSPFPIENLIRQSCLGADNPINQVLKDLNRQQFKTQAFEWELAEQTTLASDGVQANRARFTGHSVRTLFARSFAYIAAHLWKEWLFFAACTTLIGASLRFLYSPTIANYDGCLDLEDDLSACAVKTEAKLEEEFALKDNLIYGYFFIVNYQMLVILAASRSFYWDAELFRNEHRNGAFSTGAWYLVKSVLELAPLLPGVLIFVAIMDIYEPVLENRPFPVYFDIVLLMALGVLATTAIGHVISLLGGKSLASQTVLLISVLLFSLLIGNFVIPVATMHYAWQVAATFSIPRYLLESLMILQYGYGRCKGEKQISAVLYGMNISGDEKRIYWDNLRMLLLNAVIFRLIALWLLVRKMNPIENRKRRVERIETYQKKSLAVIGV